MTTAGGSTPDAEAPALVNGKVRPPALAGVFAQPWGPGKFLGLVMAFGPAAILASVSIGAGETIVVVRAGSWSEYGLLWLVLLSCVAKGVFVTYMLGRYTAITGELIGHRLVRLPGPRGWLLMTILGLEMLGAPISWVPIAKPCGDLIDFLTRPYLGDWLTPETAKNLFTSLFIVAALGSGLGLDYSRTERQQIAICCILVAGTFVGTLMVHPDLVKGLTGMLSFGRMPADPGWAPPDAVRHPFLTMATTFAYVGSSCISYVAYSNWVGVRRWGLNAHPAIEEIRAHAFQRDTIDYLPDDPVSVASHRRTLLPLRWDVGMGALVLFVVTAAFLTSGASVLFPRIAAGEMEPAFKDWSLLTDQAHIWRQIHPGLVWVYYICIGVAMWGTLQALPEIYARSGIEFLQAIWPQRNWRFRLFQRSICAYLFAVTMVLVWSNVPFDILTQIAGFVLSNFAIAIIMAAAIYLNFRLPRVYRTNAAMLLGAILTLGLLSVFAAVSGWGLLQKLAGGG